MGSPKSAPIPALPAAPPPPPNPPMFASQTAGGKRQRKQAEGNAGFGGTMLGTGMAANTSSKTLLGQ